MPKLTFSLILLVLTSLLLLNGCQSNPKHDLELPKLQAKIEATQAEDFGDLMRSMNKAGTQLDKAETIYQDLEYGRTRSDAIEYAAKGHAAATQALMHRTNAENALQRLLDPLKTDIQQNSNRLDYLEGLHVKPETNIPNRNIYFDFASSKFNAAELVKVNEIIQFLRQYPVFAIKLVGYADTVGNKSGNVKLAENRNNSVIQVLRQQGLPLNTVVTVAVGEAEGPDETQNPENRRVEIRPYVHGKYVYVN